MIYMAQNKKPKADVLQQKSPAEFFAENKNIAGFDNPGKCLYTTIRELVENSLDSAESIGKLPEVEITIEEITKSKLNTFRGLEHLDRIDEALYWDFETEDARKKRLAKEAKEQEKQAGKKAGEGTSTDPKKKEGGDSKKASAPIRGSQQYYRVTVKDNGSGMPHKDIPNMLGRVLSGTKYGIKQTRGKFGLGAKMALIWSKMTTGLPFEILSARPKQDFVSHYRLDINIHKNEPHIHKEEMLPNRDNWHGASMSLTIEGNWQYYRSKIVKYLRQIAVITPYAQFSFVYKPDDDKGDMRMVFRRRTDVMPPPPRETKHHPSSVDLELIKRLATITKASSMKDFLKKDFASISADRAVRLVEELRAGVDSSTDPRELNEKQLVRLHQLLHEVRFDDPKGDHLSPAGEYNLRLGVMKELKPDLIATHQGDTRVFEGHAFIVEAAVSIGGRDLKPGINVYRFANRIPLLFEGGSDVITRTALKRINWSSYKIDHTNDKEWPSDLLFEGGSDVITRMMLKRMNWSSYKIDHTNDKVGVFVSIVSTKIPFKGAGKEYIGDDIEEMVGAVKQAIQQCCIQLKVKIARALAAKEQKQRKRNLTKYIPNCAEAIWKVLEKMAGSQPHGPKRRRLQQESGVMDDVKAGRVSQQLLQAKLTEHVERIDTDLALEYQVQLGMAGANKQSLFLGAGTAGLQFGPLLHGDVCVIKILQ